MPRPCPNAAGLDRARAARHPKMAMTNPAPPPLIVRPCLQHDLEAVQLIYAHHVLTGFGTFEIEPPTLEQMTERWSKVAANHWPFVVISPMRDLSRVLGFAYAQPFRDRPAYDRTFEDSVYVAPNAQRQGAGLMLMGALLTQLRDDGVREVVALIGDSDNAASIGLHRKAGFRDVGVMKRVGCKFDRWIDVVVMQRTLIKPA